MEGQSGGQPQATVSLKQRLGKAILEFSSHMMPSTGGALVQVWMPEHLADGSIVLSAQGLPFAVVGVGDLLALFRCVSVRYRFSTDVMKPSLMGAIGRVYASMEPEMSNDVQNYEKQVYLRVSEAQRCRVHSTLVVPVYTHDNSHRPVAVLELVQSEKECMFPAMMSWLQQALETVQLHTCDPSKVDWKLPLWAGAAPHSGPASAAVSASRALPEPSGSSAASGDARANSAGRPQQQQQGQQGQAQHVTPSSPGTHGSDSSLRGLNKRPGSMHGSRQLLQLEEAAGNAQDHGHGQGQGQGQGNSQGQAQGYAQGQGQFDGGVEASIASLPTSRPDEAYEGTSCSLSGPHVAPAEARKPLDPSAFQTSGLQLSGQQLSMAAAAAGVPAGAIKTEAMQDQLPGQHMQAQAQAFMQGATPDDHAALQLAMRLGSGQTGGGEADLLQARELAAWMSQNGIGADALETLKALLNPGAVGQEKVGRVSGSGRLGDLGRTSAGASGASAAPSTAKVVRRSMEAEAGPRLTAPVLQAHQLLSAMSSKSGGGEGGGLPPRSGPGSAAKEDDSISSDGEGDDSDGEGRGDGKGRTGTGAGKRLRYEDLQSQFGLGLKEAAANLGMCATTLKRACRRHGIKRWPRRQIAKLNKALNEMGYQAPPPDALLQSAIKGNKSKQAGGQQQKQQQSKSQQSQQQQQQQQQPAQQVVVHRQVQHMPPPMQPMQQVPQVQRVQQQQQFAHTSDGSVVPVGMPGMVDGSHQQLQQLQPQQLQPQHLQQQQLQQQLQQHRQQQQPPPQQQQPVQQPPHVALAMYQAQLQAQAQSGYGSLPGLAGGPGAGNFHAGSSSMPPPQQQYVPALHGHNGQGHVQYSMPGMQHMQHPSLQQQQQQHLSQQQQVQQQGQGLQGQGLQGQGLQGPGQGLQGLQGQGLQGQGQMQGQDAMMLLESAQPSMSGLAAMGGVGGAQHVVAATPDASMSMSNLDFLDDQDLMEMWGANVACDLSMDNAGGFYSQGQAQPGQ